MTIENELHKIINKSKHGIIKNGIQDTLDAIRKADAETALTEEQKHSIIREHIQQHRDRTTQLILSGDITAAEQENTIALQLSYVLPQGPSPEELRQLVKNAIRDENLTGSPESINTLVTKYALPFDVSPKHLKTVAETEFAERAAHAAAVALADFLDRYGVPSESVFDTDSVRHVSPAASKNLDQVITLLDTATPAVDKLVIRVEDDNLVAYMFKTPCATEENQEPNLGDKVFEFDVPQELESRRFTTDNVTNRHLTEILKDSAPLLVDLVIIRKLLSLSGSVDLDYPKLRQVRDQLDGHVAARWADYLKRNL